MHGDYDFELYTNTLILAYLLTYVVQSDIFYLIPGVCRA